ncbi:damage-inducible protein DinB [Hydrogenophaga crassostreae]|uniref:Damage-inducible protein DinB n=1 Tax=Hydrogenophaga crassostreae TaxID=1763535 RepID=A0A167GM23_9BURK|nr:DinB family protein [Hydrogenophaga crassostreae]AOW14808.1 damage-inducible protein DinB [Hydrogenophaga crassostreae]OAD39637.1 damage-inducible protein DinB [Hydrogenophaga crassostreae]
MDAHAHFAQLARYNVWATARLLDAVAALSDEEYRRDVGLFFKSIHGTLNHLLVGEHAVWFRRFSLGESPQKSEGVSLDMEMESDRAKLAKALLDGAAKWAPLIASWPAERFDSTLDYNTMNGTPVSLPFAATLAHVFNHGTHHRGQLSAALTALGQSGPDLDLVVLLQQTAAATKKTNA